jgi:hypothetical protein
VPEVLLEQILHGTQRLEVPIQYRIVQIVVPVLLSALMPEVLLDKVLQMAHIKKLPIQ